MSFNAIIDPFISSLRICGQKTLNPIAKIKRINGWIAVTAEVKETSPTEKARIISMSPLVDKVSAKVARIVGCLNFFKLDNISFLFIIKSINEQNPKPSPEKKKTVPKSRVLAAKSNNIYNDP